MLHSLSPNSVLSSNCLFLGMGQQASWIQFSGCTRHSPGLANHLITCRQSHTNASTQPSAPHWATFSLHGPAHSFHRNGAALSGLLCPVSFTWRIDLKIRVAALACLVLTYLTLSLNNNVWNSTVRMKGQQVRF